MQSQTWRCSMVQTIEDGRFIDPVTKIKYASELELPVGAIWYGRVSKILGIKLPGNHGYNRYCPSLERGMELVGQLPRITVTSPIVTPYYCGKVVDGYIYPDTEGREFCRRGLRLVVQSK